MKKFKLIGADALDVPAVGRVDVTRNSIIEVEDPTVSEQFEQQPDVWEHVPDPKRSAAAKKAATKKTSPADQSGPAPVTPEES